MTQRARDLYRHALNKNLVLERGGLSGRIVRSVGARFGPLLARGARALFSERVVEYPFVLRALPDPPLRVLDLGAYEDLLAMHLASLGYEVVARDLRGYPFEHENLAVDRRDVFDGVEPASFDAVVSVSTIEHVGLASANGVVDDEGDRRCVEILLRAVRPGGVLVATVLFGRAQTLPGFRVYDPVRLDRTFPGSDVTVFQKDSAFGTWRAVPPEAAADAELDSGVAPVRAVACLVCRR